MGSSWFVDPSLVSWFWVLVQAVVIGTVLEVGMGKLAEWFDSDTAYLAGKTHDSQDVLGFFERLNPKVWARSFLAAGRQVVRLLRRNQSHRRFQTLAIIKHVIDIRQDCCSDHVLAARSQSTRRVRHTACHTALPVPMAARLALGSQRTSWWPWHFLVGHVHGVDTGFVL